MTRLARTAIVALTLAAPLALHGCVSSHGTASLDVEASIASVTLANDCGEARGAAPGLWAGDCAEDAPDCGGWCQQTGVQLAIEAGDGEGPVPFEIVSVRLHTMEGALLGELDPRAARIFTDEGYASWDEHIAPGARLFVSYDTSSPDWTAIGGGNAWATYGMSFRIVMVVRIDGVERTLEHAPASREAEIVT